MYNHKYELTESFELLSNKIKSRKKIHLFGKNFNYSL